MVVRRDLRVPKGHPGLRPGRPHSGAITKRASRPVVTAAVCGQSSGRSPGLVPVSFSGCCSLAWHVAPEMWAKIRRAQGRSDQRPRPSPWRSGCSVGPKRVARPWRGRLLRLSVRGGDEQRAASHHARRARPSPAEPGRCGPPGKPSAGRPPSGTAPSRSVGRGGSLDLPGSATGIEPSRAAPRARPAARPRWPGHGRG